MTCTSFQKIRAQKKYNLYHNQYKPMPSKAYPTDVICACGSTATLKRIPNRTYQPYKCRSCAIKTKWQDDEYRESLRLAAIKRNPPDQKSKARKSQRISDALRGKKHNADRLEIDRPSAKKRWADQEYRNKTLAAIRDDNHRANLSVMLKEKWASGSLSLSENDLKLRSERSKALWADPDYRAKVLASKSTADFKAKMATIQKSMVYLAKLSASAARQPRVSSIQRILYSILDDLKVPYFVDCDPACLIGPWSFDCRIPRADKPDLLIECQGDWIHSQKHKRIADQAKAAYIAQVPGFELKAIWEHEFSNYNRVVDLLKYWLGLSSLDQIQFEFKDVTITDCPPNDYKLLLSKYHYLANAGRGGIAYGAYIGSSLIAVCVFSPPARQNVTINDLKQSQFRELSRLCIHPSYQKKHFASWFVARCIKRLPEYYKAVLTYCDTTFNHHGITYLACNFKEDGICQPDYWYVSEDGWVMHKKTLYNKAINLKLTESEFALKFNYHKVYGSAKKRFVFIRPK